jgi:ferredoxin--NADP+ reductase
MLATGTALGPFLSFLKTDEPWQRFEKLILVHAVRHAEDLNYAEIIAGFQAGHPEQFSFIPFVSREKHETALDGRIPEAIENGRLEGRAGVAIDPADSQFMLCGNLGMIQDTTAALQKRGLEKNRRQKPGQITTEKYW